MRIYTLEISNNAQTITPTLTRSLKPHSSPAVVTAVDDTGALLATGCADGTLKVWSIAGGYASHTFKGHSGVISSLKFFRTPHPDSTAGQDAAFRLASGGEDGRIRVWDLGKRKPLASLDAHSSAITSIDFSVEQNALLSGSRDKTLTVCDTRTWKSRKVLPVLESIEAVGFIADGRLVFCGGESGQIRLWDIERAQEITRRGSDAAQQNPYKAILHVPNLQTIICIREDYVLEYQDLSITSDWTPGQSIERLPMLRRISGTHDEIIDLAFVAPGKDLMALATNTESIKLIQAQKHEADENGVSFGADVALLEGHEDIILCLDADLSGEWLATGAKDNTARLWKYNGEERTFDCTTVFTGHAGSVGAISLAQTMSRVQSGADRSLDAPRFLVTGSQDRTVKIWDVKLGAEPSSPFSQSRATYTRKAHDKDINAIALSYDSRMFASASQDRLVKIWSVEECEVQGVLRGHKRGVWSVSFAPAGTPSISGESGAESSRRGFILTGSGDRTVKIWSLGDYGCLKSFEGHVNSVLKVVWIPPPPPDTAGATSKRPLLVASAGGDGLVKVWDVQSGECAATLDNHTERVWALGFDGASQRLVSGGGDGVLTFWADTTEATAATAAANNTARVEQEQLLQNHVRRGNYREAIVLALQLNHPARLLALFSDVVLKTETPEAGSLCGVQAVDNVIAGLDDANLFTLLLRLRDWNANARTAPVAQKILWVVFKTFPAARLVGLRKDGRGLGDVLDGLQAYTDRHFRRTDELLEESYLVDFVVRSMEESAFVEARPVVPNGVNGHAVEAVVE